MTDAPTQLPDRELVCRCENCGLYYPVGRAGIPVTDRPYTCDDCGGYVMDEDETAEWNRHQDPGGGG